jgi:group I intron endonuclease
MDKKELKKKYKQTMRPMGVYQIKNLVNGKIFIGSSSDIPGKINSQKFQLSLGSHMNQELQKDYKVFGIENFSFEVLDYLEPKDVINYDYTDDLKALKEMWIEKLLTSSPKGYN